MVVTAACDAPRPTVIEPTGWVGCTYPLLEPAGMELEPVPETAAVDRSLELLEELGEELLELVLLLELGDELLELGDELLELGDELLEFVLLLELLEGLAELESVTVPPLVGPPLVFALADPPRAKDCCMAVAEEAETVTCTVLFC